MIVQNLFEQIDRTRYHITDLNRGDLLLTSYGEFFLIVGLTAGGSGYYDAICLSKSKGSYLLSYCEFDRADVELIRNECI